MERLKELSSASEITANAEAIAAGAETGQVVCEREKLVAELKAIPLSEDSKAANRMAVNRAIESLSDKEKIGLSENYVWLSEHIEH
jgi:UDP-N-acetylmuramoylalanine-D-glutamate ligase